MSLTPEEIAHETPLINESKTPAIISTAVVFGALALTAVVTRLYARKLSCTKYGWDDWAIIISLFFTEGLVVATIMMAHFGEGEHILKVAENPSNFVNIAKVELALSICYPPSIAITKLSILALFARTFTLRSRPFKIALYSLVAVVTAWLIALWLVVFLQCNPIHSEWDGNPPCTPKQVTTITTGVFNAVTDLGILALPQPLLWNLHMPTSRKMLLSCLFLIGALATAMAIARIPLLLQESGDITWLTATGTIFTVLEPTLAITCACLPMTHIIYRKANEAGYGLGSLRSLLPRRVTGSNQGSEGHWSRMRDEAGRSSSGERSVERQAERIKNGWNESVESYRLESLPASEGRKTGKPDSSSFV